MKSRTLNFLKLILIIATSNQIFASDQILQEDFFGNIAVRTIKSYENSIVENKIYIQLFTVEPPTKENMKNRILFPTERIYQSPIFTITERGLPVTEDMCLEIDASTCKEHSEFWKGICVDPCITGLNPLAFDKKNNILYFSAASTNLGTGGGDYFIFAGEITAKKVKFLKIEGNPLSGSLSPSGKYLLFSGFNGIKVYNTLTGEEIQLSEENDWTQGHEHLHYLGNITWITDTQFKYQDGMRHSKFQPSFDEVKENTYDIPSKKIINSRIMDKNEYDSRPYVES